PCHQPPPGTTASPGGSGSSESTVMSKPCAERTRPLAPAPKIRTGNPAAVRISTGATASRSSKPSNTITTVSGRAVKGVIIAHRPDPFTVIPRAPGLGQSRVVRRRPGHQRQDRDQSALIEQGDGTVRPGQPG